MMACGNPLDIEPWVIGVSGRTGGAPGRQFYPARLYPASAGGGRHTPQNHTFTRVYALPRPSNIQSIEGEIMRHLVLGGTGTVGSQVVKGLLEKGETVRVLTRSEERARELAEGATAVIGDLLEPSTYDTIFTDFDHLFLLNAVAPTELHEGLVALEEGKRAGAKRIVYLSVQAVDKGPHIPHFASKIQIADAIEKSGIPFTVLRPSNFYQNDLWSQQAILEYGVYPQPLGDVGVSRVDVSDVAAAAVRALTEPGFENRTVELVGPEALTGEDCARAFSRALDREIAFGGNDLDAWEEQARQWLPHWMAWDFRVMYAMFQREGLVASESELAGCREILGRDPRPFDDFVAETVAKWEEAAAGVSGE
jgi:uncharacterized protein YbjT (DUF2867 family)